MDYCHCGMIAAERVASTDANAGRRFRNCSNGGCGFFKWVDAPLCNRAKVVIPGLLRRLRSMKAENEKKLIEVKKMKNRKRRLRMVLVFVFFFVVYVTVSGDSGVRRHHIHHC